ncbi:carboxymuconolactone decarboxylase family protein [Amycolatopsis sp. FDAARGOS 1241]|uniref:carboxymuconolactone decarboxylase family protein n=1 Tax=Amycolatopsis sp. FDAARGOS 1241 TaxID=2778070 RepID=UPI00351CA563
MKPGASAMPLAKLDNQVYGFDNHIDYFTGDSRVALPRPHRRLRPTRRPSGHDGDRRAFGSLPAAVARLATSPELLNGFLRLSALFESTTLDPLERETLILTVAARNRCHFWVALHTARLLSVGGSAELVAALRSESPLPVPRLEAVRRFALTVLATAGGVPAADLDTFLAAGYTPQQALEVVLGIATYTLSTFANRLVDRHPAPDPGRARVDGGLTFLGLVAVGPRSWRRGPTELTPSSVSPPWCR